MTISFQGSAELINSTVGRVQFADSSLATRYVYAPIAAPVNCHGNDQFLLTVNFLRAM